MFETGQGACAAVCALAEDMRSRGLPEHADIVEMAADGTATGSGRNGALTAALLKHLGTPGQTLEHMATRVVREVTESTADQAPDGSRRQQTPEYVSSLTVHGLCLLPAAAQPEAGGKAQEGTRARACECRGG